MYRSLDAPLSVHLELTSKCNHKCRHCYNFWRPSEQIPSVALTKESAVMILDQLSESGVFHVTLTGGEPLLNMDTLVFVMKELARRNISFSLNSNASLLTEHRAVALRAAGLKTILISLLSYDQTTQDFMAGRSGSYEKTIRGIECGKKNGLRIAINMVVGRANLSHVLRTGWFAKELGAVAFSATRVMPPRYDTDSIVPEFVLGRDDVRIITQQMVQLKNSDLYLESLVPYPTCFLQTSEEIEIFAGRTCSAGKTSCAIGADGSIRACPHYEEKCGELRCETLRSIWAKMSNWRDGSLLPDECRICHSIGRCGGGCRIAAPGRSLCSKDPLMQSQATSFFSPKKRNVITSIGLDDLLRIRPRCRFRDDAEVGIINTGGIKNTLVNHATLQLLRDISVRLAFTPKQLKSEYLIQMEDSDYLYFLSELICKDVIERVV